MNRKTRILIEILILIVAAVVYFFIEVWPDFKKLFGSSDHFINTKVYKNMFEFNIDSSINFALVVNEDKEIYHIFFYNENSKCLYNKNIENKNVDDALSSVVKILIDKNYLKNTSNVSVTKYDNFYDDEFYNSLNSILKKYHINININYNEATLINKAKE